MCFKKSINNIISSMLKNLNKVLSNKSDTLKYQNISFP